MFRSIPFIFAALFFVGCGSVIRNEELRPENVNQKAWDLAEQVNEHRERMGLPALEWDSDLWRVAQQHNEDMRNRHYFSHYNPEGESPFDRLREAYIFYCRAAENLAVGQSTHEVVLSNWLRSPEHKSNIESSLYTHHAVAYDPIGNYWTHLFINYGGEKPFPLISVWTRYPRDTLKE